MENFQFYVPVKIHFGRGALSNLGSEIQHYGRKVLLLSGKGSTRRNGIYASVVKELTDHGIKYTPLEGVDPNPRISTVRKGAEICKQNGLDFILALGGGSVIDCAKAISFAACYEGDPWDFWDLKTDIEKTLPLGTVLTLSATGSEMNWGSVISNEELQEKRGKSHPLFMPRFSILDPEYTFTVPAFQTAAGTADIMSHVFEFYFSPVKTAFLQDGFAGAILKTCLKYGPIAIEEPENYEARSNLMWASSMALNGVVGRGKLFEGILHGVEHAISALYDITHGAGLALLTVPWFEFILDENTQWRFADYARNVWKIDDPDDGSAAKKGIVKTRDFYKSLGLPLTFAEAGIEKPDLEAILDRTITEGTKGNLRPLTRGDIRKILENCL